MVFYKNGPFQRRSRSLYAQTLRAHPPCTPPQRALTGRHCCYSSSAAPPRTLWGRALVLYTHLQRHMRLLGELTALLYARDVCVRALPDRRAPCTHTLPCRGVRDSYNTLYAPRALPARAPTARHHCCSTPALPRRSLIMRAAVACCRTRDLIMRACLARSSLIGSRAISTRFTANHVSLLHYMACRASLRGLGLSLTLHRCSYQSFAL